jgi:large subunit ribosomal protein L4
MKAPKTSTIATIISQLNLDNKKTLVILPEYDENIYLSTRNIPNVASTLLADINTYDIMNADILVITEGAAKIFNEEEAVVA